MSGESTYNSVCLFLLNVQKKINKMSTKNQQKRYISKQMKKDLLWENRSFTQNAYEENQCHQYSINKREFILGAKY